MIRRGEIHWADLGQPRGSALAKRRPVVIVRLPKDSAINVSAIVTLDRSVLDSYVGRLASGLVSKLHAGLRTVLAVRR